MRFSYDHLGFIVLPGMIFDEATVIVPAAATRGIDRREFTLVDLIVTAMYFYLMAVCFASLFNGPSFYLSFRVLSLWFSC